MQCNAMQCKSPYPSFCRRWKCAYFVNEMTAQLKHSNELHFISMCSALHCLLNAMQFKIRRIARQCNVKCNAIQRNAMH
jgi:hypothetical protein